MKRKKRTFSREYKLAAVKKIVEQGIGRRAVNFPSSPSGRS
jgi:transposase-like protein